MKKIIVTKFLCNVIVYIGYIDLAHIRYISNWQSEIELISQLLKWMYLSFACLYSKSFSYRRLLNKHSIEFPIARYETHLNIDLWILTEVKRQSNITRELRARLYLCLH